MDEPEALRNRVKVRLMLAGVDRETVELLSDDDKALDLLRTSVLWRGEPPITITELAERAGLDVVLVRRARMLLGLPDPGDEPLCRVDEVDAFVGFAAGIEMFGVEPVLQFTRVIGSAMGNVAEGALTVFARALTDHPGDEPLEGDAYALAAFDALEAFSIVPTVLAIVAKLQFDLANQRLGADPGQHQIVAIGFVDLTGSSRATEQLGIDVTAAAMSQFEERAVELAVNHGGRVVKFIGDEVMFMAPDIEAGTAVAVGLLQHVADEPVLRSARAGVAFGPVLSRDGDWFGTTVNLAARLVEKAKAGTVLVAGEGASDIDDAVDHGRRRLRGLADRPEVWKLTVT